MLPHGHVTRSGSFSTPFYKERLQVIAPSAEKGSQKIYIDGKKKSYNDQEGLNDENTSGEIIELTKQVVSYADQVKELKKRLHRQQEMFHNEKNARTAMERRAEAAEKSVDGLEARAKNAEARAKAANHTVETTKNRCRDLGILCSYQALKVRELATMINLFLTKLEEQREKAKVNHDKNPFVKCSSPSMLFSTHANTEDATSNTTSFESAFGSSETIQGKGAPNPCKRTGCHARLKIGMESRVARPNLWQENPHRTPRNLGDSPKKMHSTSKMVSKEPTVVRESPWLPFKTTTECSKKNLVDSEQCQASSKTPTPRDCPRLPFKTVASISGHSSCSPQTSTTLATSRSDRSTWWPFKAHKKENSSPSRLQPKRKSPQKPNDDGLKVMQKVPFLPLKSILSCSPRDRSCSPARMSVSQSPGSQSDSKSVSFRSSNHDAVPGFENYSDLHRNDSVVHCLSGIYTKAKEKTMTPNSVSVKPGSPSSSGGEVIVYRGSTSAGELEMKSSSKDSQPSSIDSYMPKADKEQIDADGEIVGQLSRSIFEAFGDQHCEPSLSSFHLHGSVNQFRSSSPHSRGSDTIICGQISPICPQQFSNSTTNFRSGSVSPNSDVFSQQESSRDDNSSPIDEVPKEKPCLLDPATTYESLIQAVPPVVAPQIPDNSGTGLEIVLYNPDIFRISSDSLPHLTQCGSEGEDCKIVPLSMKLCSNSPSETDPIPLSCANDPQNNCGSPSYIRKKTSCDDDQLQMVVYKHLIAASEQDTSPNALAQRISPRCESPIYNNLLQPKDLTPQDGSPKISETSPVVSRETSPRGPHRREIGWNRFFSRSGFSSRKVSPRTLVSVVMTQTKTLVPRIRGGGLSDFKQEAHDFESLEKHQVHGLLEMKGESDCGHTLQGSRENGFYSHREQKGDVHLHFQVIKGYHSHRDYKRDHDSENTHKLDQKSKEILHLNLKDARKQVDSSRYDSENDTIVTTPRLSLRLNTVQEGFFKEDKRRTVFEQRADELSKTCAYQAKKLAEVAHQLQQFPIRLDEQLRRWAALEAKRKYEDRLQAAAQKRICNYGEVELSPTISPSRDAIIQAETPRSIRHEHVVEDRLSDQLKVVRMMKAVAEVKVTFLRARLKKLEAKLKTRCEIAPTPYENEVDVWRCGSRFLMQVFLFGLGFSTLPNIWGGFPSLPSPT